MNDEEIITILDWMIDWDHFEKRETSIIVQGDKN